MTESKIEKIIREVSFAAQCAEMALQGVKAAAYDSDLLSFPEVQELSEVNYRLDYLTEDLKNLAEKLKVAHMTEGGRKMRGNLFYIVHPAGQLKELNRRAALGELEEKLEALRNAIEKLDPSECTAAVRRLSRGVDRVLGVIQRAHSKADRGFVRVLDEEGSGNGD